MTPENYIYVNNQHQGEENGGVWLPYSTIVEGKDAIPAMEAYNPKGGKLWIKAGTYTGSSNIPVTFDQSMEIASYMGDVNIGNRLILKSSGLIRIGLLGTMELK